MKRSAPDAFGDLTVVLPCLRHGPLRQDNGIAVQVSIESIDTVQRCLSDL
jgi:hypothetical protein